MQHRVLVAISLVIASLGSNASNARPATLLGGFSKADITPTEPVTLSGYASRKDVSTGIHDPLSVRVSAFQWNERRVVFVSTDIIDYYNGTSAIFRKAILDACKLATHELFLAAIHTHAGPTIILDEERGHPHNIAYSKSLQKKLIAAIQEALAAMQPIKIGMGKGTSAVGVNRREVFYDKAGNPRMWIGRNPHGVQDKEVSVLKIVDGDDKLLTVLWEYAMHSTALGWKNFQVSGDVHGLAEQFIERYLGNEVMAPAFAGASGDIDPWYRVLPGFETKNGWIPEPVLMGTMLGQEVIHVLRKIEDPSTAGPVKSIFQTIELPGKPSGKLETTQDHPTAPINVTLARVGNVAFVGLGAEVLCEIGLAIKAASPFDHTVIITHCNGTADYISPQYVYIEGGYEVESSPFASTAADQLIKEVVKRLHELQ